MTLNAFFEHQLCYAFWKFLDPILLDTFQI